MRALLIALLFFPAFVSGVHAASEQTETSFKLTVTAYNAVAAQTSNNRPHITASGTSANPQTVAAVAPRLLKKLPFGTVVRIETKKMTAQPRSCGIRHVQHLIGDRVVADTMAPSAQGVDVLMPKRALVTLPNGRRVNPAVALGFCREVSVKVVAHINIHDPKRLPRTQAELIAMVREQQQANGDE